MAKQKHYTKVKKSLVVLGLIGALFVGTFTLTGCSTSELKQAQQNIDTSVTAVLNSSDIQEVENGLFSGYTFLCADVEHAENSQYSIDINGIAKHSDSGENSYTTITYLVSDSYFSTKESTKSDAAIINTLSEIVQNENYQSYTIANVKNLDNLNNSMGKATESPLDGFRFNQNFLYSVGDVSLNTAENVASFSTKELIKFSRTRTETTMGIIGYSNGQPKWGPVIRTVVDYESFYIDNMVYIKLTPEEMAQAQVDESIVFQKFAEYVKNDQKDKFVVQQLNIADQKQYDANMKDRVSFRDLEK